MVGLTCVLVNSQTLFRAHLGGVVPWKQIVDLALLMALDDGRQRCG